MNKEFDRPDYSDAAEIPLRFYEIKNNYNKITSLWTKKRKR